MLIEQQPILLSLAKRLRSRWSATHRVYFDHGGELSASYFITPKKFMVYGRTSAIAGQFGNSYEWAGGYKWFFVPNQRVWFQGEIMRVVKSAYGSNITPYTGGMTGWVPVLQTIFSF